MRRNVAGVRPNSLTFRVCVRMNDDTKVITWFDLNLIGSPIDRLSLAALLVFIAAAAIAETPEAFAPTPPDRARQLTSDKWIDTLQREVPPLKNLRGTLP